MSTLSQTPLPTRDAQCAALKSVASAFESGLEGHELREEFLANEALLGNLVKYTEVVLGAPSCWVLFLAPLLTAHI